MPEAYRARIQGICTDLKPTYRNLIRRELPGVRVVADHFHVIADANRRLDETRRLEQTEAKASIQRWPLVKNQEQLTPRQSEQLQATLARFASLKEQHWLKEGCGPCMPVVTPR